MMSLIATILTIAVIGALFYLDREREDLTSPALWLPTIWLTIIASRPVSMWLHMDRDVSIQDRFTEGSPLDAGVYGLLMALALLTLNRR